jgi:hypothetical protein
MLGTEIARFFNVLGRRTAKRIGLFVESFAEVD